MSCGLTCFCLLPLKWDAGRIGESSRVRPADSKHQTESYFFAAALIPQSLQSFFSAFLTSQHFFFAAAVLTAQQDFLAVAFAAGFVWAITLVLITAIASARINVFIVFFLPGHALFRNKDILQCLHGI